MSLERNHRIEKIRQAAVRAFREQGSGRGDRLDSQAEERLGLSDVLAAISTGPLKHEVAVRTGGQIWVGATWTTAAWNLSRDSITKQKDETIAVIESLI